MHLSYTIKSKPKILLVFGPTYKAEAILSKNISSTAINSEF